MAVEGPWPKCDSNLRPERLGS